MVAELIAERLVQSATPALAAAMAQAAVHPTTGHIFVADNDQLHEFDEQGVFVASHAGMTAGAGAIYLAINPNTGEIWVSEFVNNTVARFSAAGVFIAEYAGFTALAGLMGVAINPVTNHVFIVENNLSNLAELTEAGVFVAEHAGMAPAAAPMDIVWHSYTGHFFITENNVSRLAEYDGNGTFIVEHGGMTPATAPRGLAVSPTTNHIWVAQSAAGTVAEFSNAGVFIAEHATTGAGSSGVSVGSNGHIFVTDPGTAAVYELTQDGVLVNTTVMPGTILAYITKSTAVGAFVITDQNSNTVWLLYPQHYSPIPKADVRGKGFMGYDQRDHTKTNSGGHFTLEFPGEMTSEKITVEITKPGYTSVTAIVHPRPWACRYHFDGPILMMQSERVFFTEDNYNPV